MAGMIKRHKECQLILFTDWYDCRLIVRLTTKMWFLSEKDKRRRVQMHTMQWVRDISQCYGVHSVWKCTILYHWYRIFTERVFTQWKRTVNFIYSQLVTCYATYERWLDYTLPSTEPRKINQPSSFVDSKILKQRVTLQTKV